jgi:hypothetical protein
LLLKKAHRCTVNIFDVESRRQISCFYRALTKYTGQNGLYVPKKVSKDSLWSKKYVDIMREGGMAHCIVDEG